MGPSLTVQEFQPQIAKEYDDNDANNAGILSWVHKNVEIPLDPPAPKSNRPKSVADGNPSEPSDDT